MSIELKGDLLSVDLQNAQFGKVLSEIAKQKGFRTEVNREVSQRKLSTKFRDIELERGILRLLTLMKEKNYTIHYDSAGAVSFVDVYGGASPASPGRVQTQPTKPLIQRAITTPPPQSVQPGTTAPAGAAQPVRRPPVPVTTFRRPAAPPAPQPEQPASEAGTTYNDIGPEEDVSEIPYIPPQTKPVYIPPRTK